MIYIEMGKLIRLGQWYTVLGTCIVGLSWAMLVCLPNGLWAQRKADFGMVMTFEGVRPGFRIQEKGYAPMTDHAFGAEFWMERSSHQHSSLAIGLGLTRFQVHWTFDSIQSHPNIAPCGRYPCASYEQRQSSMFLHTPMMFRYHFQEAKRGPYCGIGADFGLLFGGSYHHVARTVQGEIRDITGPNVLRRLSLAGQLFLGYRLPLHGRKALFWELSAKAFAIRKTWPYSHFLTAGIRMGCWF